MKAAGFWVPQIMMEYCGREYSVSRAESVESVRSLSSRP